MYRRVQSYRFFLEAYFLNHKANTAWTLNMEVSDICESQLRPVYLASYPKKQDSLHVNLF